MTEISNPAAPAAGGAGLAKVALAMAVAALIVGAFAFLAGGGFASGAAPADREINLLAVEYKGTAGTGEKLAEGSKVSAYAWNPASMAVNKGDRVTLSIYGVNGGAHPTVIEGYPGTAYKVTDPNGTVIEQGTGAFNVYRGHTTEVKFTADKAGIFKIACATHQPTMNGYLYVLG